MALYTAISELVIHLSSSRNESLVEELDDIEDLLESQSSEAATRGQVRMPFVTKDALCSPSRLRFGTRLEDGDPVLTNLKPVALPLELIDQARSDGVESVSFGPGRKNSAASLNLLNGDRLGVAKTAEPIYKTRWNGKPKADRGPIEPKSLALELQLTAQTLELLAAPLAHEREPSGRRFGDQSAPQRRRRVDERRNSDGDVERDGTFAKSAKIRAGEAELF